MPQFTYITDSELREYSRVEDTDLNELLQEVRQKFGNRYWLQTRVFWDEPKWFRKQKSHTLYQLYIGNGGEVQIFNFPSSEGGINTYVTKAKISTLFLGMINGFLHASDRASD